MTAGGLTKHFNKVSTKKMKYGNLWLAICGCLAMETPAMAHHSTASFDYTKTTALAGTVRDFQWTNPHCWLQLEVPNPQGGHVEWSVESGSPSLARSLGWDRDAFKPGDHVAVKVAPARDGSRTGTLKSATLANGKVISGPGTRGQLPASAFPTLNRATPN
jgi:hypothetical protein